LILCPNLLLGTCCWTHIGGGASHLGASNCSHQHSPHTSIADDELETIRGGANSFCHSDLPTFPLAGYPPTKSKRGGNGHIHCLSLIFPAINLHFSRGFSSPRLITRGYFSWSGWGFASCQSWLQHRGRALAMSLLEESLGGADRERSGWWSHQNVVFKLKHPNVTFI
jgi:hypothetical protein